MKVNLYLIECLTNLHVGNGEANFNIVDNEVERDVVTNYPTINASGVKGALRAYFEECKMEKEVIDNIFGKEKPGALKFMSANLYAQAVQNIAGTEPFKLVQPKVAKELFDKTVRDFGIALKGEIEKIKVELVEEDVYQSYDLPIIARNKLNNGISENLWYEQVVPHHSVFYTMVIGDGEDLDTFDEKVDGKIVQFGANASIGYGLCKLTRLN